MADINKFIAKSESSAFYRWLLNFSMKIVVPFNAPHGLRILSIQPGRTVVQLPYKKRNLNHLKGMHACALATLCEYSVGLSLVSKLGQTEYRFIMKELSVEYLYQAKMHVTAGFHLTDEVYRSEILEPLKSLDAVFVKFEVPVYDVSGNHICTGRTIWQIKKWEKVTVKV